MPGPGEAPQAQGLGQPPHGGNKLKKKKKRISRH
jgi:hypothetical protein